MFEKSSLKILFPFIIQAVQQEEFRLVDEKDLISLAHSLEDNKKERNLLWARLFRHFFLFFLRALLIESQFANKKAIMNLQKLDLQVAIKRLARVGFHAIVIFLLPTNDSLTRLNVKSTSLRWLNLWSVRLDGMHANGILKRVVYDGI